MNFSHENIEDILGVLRLAGDAIMQYYKLGSVDTIYKKDNSPVTIADTTANDIICDFLTKKYPDIPIISEERPLVDFEIRKHWQYLWLVDPLDGTKEFLNKTDEFTINLALVKDGQAIAGFIHLPAFGSMYYAVKDHGAYEVRDQFRTSLQVNKISLIQSELRVVSSRSYTDERTNAYISVLDNPTIVKLGSALKFVAIAKGEADYYPRMIHIMEWDTAAGQVIIEEAGGHLVEAASGLPLVYNKPSMVNPYFIASGKLLG